MLDLAHTALVDLLDALYSNELEAEAAVATVLKTLLPVTRSRSGAFFRFTSGYDDGCFRMRSVSELHQIGPEAKWSDGSLQYVLTTPFAEPVFGKTLANTTSAVTGPVPVPGWREIWGAPVVDAVNVISRDVCGNGIGISLGLDERTSPSAREERLLVRLATHLGAADRLRGERAVAEADAVLSPNGKVLHVSDPTQLAPMRDGFERRAAARKQRHDAERALEVWQGLVDGRWSIVDHFDTDGKRLVLAIKNAPDANARIELKPADRRVAALAAMGHRDKEIAYILGITLGSVAAALRRARAAFRAKTRSELAAKWRRASE